MTATVRPDEWHSDKWSHESIMDMQARLAPQDIKRLAGEWKDTLGTLDSLFATFLADVTVTIEGGWSGPGARAALGTMRAYVENSRAALDKAYTLSSGLDVLARATGELQEQISPPPVPVVAHKLGDIPRWGTPFAEQLSLWQQAQAQVQTVYSTPAIQAGNAVAELTGPRERLRFGAGPEAIAAESAPERHPDEQAERAGEFLARWGLGEQEPNPQTSPQGAAAIPSSIPVTVTGIPGKPFPGKGSGMGSAPGAGHGDLGEDDVYADQNWMRDPLWREGPTHSAGYESAPPTPRGTLSPDRLPAFGPGQAGQAVTSGGGLGGGVGSRSLGALMPMMGAYPPQATQRRGDENEHFSPPYLVNADNTRELLGDLPKASAPVIGLWDSDCADEFDPPPRRGFRSR
ncbi:hypothetical protein AWB85_14405 [Mycobacteroides immunogenum]|uniref:PPE family domain-containing protein n=1 Tax=Mycobacteroides immunogenum TaxID=83262 RepID=A0A179V8H6_9MYCO|nr:hypothetical protein [Mycobacteroides immunogenum]OAT67323.1 hypothetical protein AWB85_14405 [Mycobacteroides immunogenum]